ncbi:tyrosine-protein phosphatase [Gordonia sp. zg691]|uniref:tyrosine-protein phosphatase n=1 Tax=Gordonia jinghuaiqii TaxID=2758710 RepID=UPI00166262F9|nr:tyrosine-protein phosphatase [Gordonia jinghuaiqii]MBD0860343.1 tyrosine-protein phosphatase [Gordonia jinghuaiqii]
MIGLERRIPVPGTSNLRDIGGYRTTDGLTVARGRILRAEALVMPGGSETYAIYDQTAAEHYERLGLRTVVDLRAANEMRRAPTAWATVCRADLVEIPIAEGGEGTDTNYMRLLLSGDMPFFGVDDMARFYVGLVERRAEELGKAVRLLSDSRRLPVLVHCAAGKDRTGVLIALVLSALGVPEDQVVADFAMTGVLRPNRIDTYAHLFREADRDPEIGRVLFESPPEAMSVLLNHLDTEYGGPAGYLRDRAGVGPEILSGLRSAMLVGDENSAAGAAST